MPQPGQPNMQQLLKQAQKMQQDMMQAQESLKDETVEASAGGGMVDIRRQPGFDVLQTSDGHSGFLK